VTLVTGCQPLIYCHLQVCGKIGSFACFGFAGCMCGKQMCQCVLVATLSGGMTHNVSAYCVAGLGALVKWPSAMTSATCCKIVPRDRTKLRNKNYNATLNPRNEICTVLCTCAAIVRT